MGTLGFGISDTGSVGTEGLGITTFLLVGAVISSTCLSGGRPSSAAGASGSGAGSAAALGAGTEGVGTLGFGTAEGFGISGSSAVIASAEMADAAAANSLLSTADGDVAAKFTIEPVFTS